MCDEFVCSDSGVVSLCEDDRKLLASLGAKKPQKIQESERSEETDNNNVESETNRNLNTDFKTDQQGIELREKINYNLATFIRTIWSYSLLIVLIPVSQSTPQFQKWAVNVLMDSGFNCSKH